MKRCLILMVVVLFLPGLISQVSGGTTLVINHAEYDPVNKNIVLYGANFDSFGAVEVWIGDINLTSLDDPLDVNCKIGSTQLKCGVGGTPAEAGGTWVVRLAACNAPHCQAEIHLAIIPSATECNSGDYVECYTGSPGSSGVGECVSGIRTCVDGVWSGCEDEIPPVPEVCVDGLDNDCDSLVDCDDPDCSESPSCDCIDNDRDGYGVGTTCLGPDCDDENPGTFPGATEWCNEIDDNCNGLVDESTDFSSDENNCGYCGVVCEPWEVCCNHVCVDLDSDELNCGDCGFVCGESEDCVLGACTCGDSGDCAPYEECCNDVCIDLMADNLNCGACGNVCRESEACVLGTCTP